MNVNASTAQAGIVVGLDGSEESLLALRWALAEGARRSEVVEVVHCWYAHSMVDALFGTGPEMRTGSECMLQNEVARARDELDNPPEIRTASVHGHPVSNLVSRSAGARLLVIGARGYRGLKERLLGHVSDGCVRRAVCSVAVVDGLDVTVTAPRHPRAADGSDAVLPVG